MDLRSSGRSSRSRSKPPAPFATTNIEQEFVRENSIQQSFTRSTRRTTAIFKTGNGSNAGDYLSEEYNSSIQVQKPVIFKRITRSGKFHKTSDYSSEEGENEVSSTRSMDENQRNRILEDAQKMADESSEITALGLYRKAKRYWDEYPKTDWTYSPFSKDRVEIAPGEIAMPNMSRRHVSSYDKYTNTQSTLRPTVLFSTSETRALTRTKKFASGLLLLFINVAYFLWKPVFSSYTLTNTIFITIAKSIYRMTCRVMLMDTWLLKSRRNGRRTVSLLALCLVPLILFAGFYLYLVSGISIAPSCHPNCEKIVITYIKSLSNSLYNFYHNIINNSYLTRESS